MPIIFIRTLTLKMNSFHSIYCIVLLLFSYASNAQSLTNSIEEILVHASLVPISSERSANAITLIDYENIRDNNGRRYLGFGRFAGIIGCYNSLALYEEFINEHEPFFIKSKSIHKKHF